MIVKETEDYKIEGSYQDDGAIKSYKFVVTEFTGIHADLNSGQYIGEIRTILVLPSRVILVTETDAEDQDFDIGGWAPDEFEWTEGSDENIKEVFEKYADLN